MYDWWWGNSLENGKGSDWRLLTNKLPSIMDSLNPYQKSLMTFKFVWHVISFSPAASSLWIMMASRGGGFRSQILSNHSFSQTRTNRLICEISEKTLVMISKNYLKEGVKKSEKNLCAVPACNQRCCTPQAQTAAEKCRLALAGLV